MGMTLPCNLLAVTPLPTRFPGGTSDGCRVRCRYCYSTTVLVKYNGRNHTMVLLSSLVVVSALVFSLCNGVTGQHHLTLCPSTLQTVATGGLNPQESFLTVLDVECIDAKVSNSL